MLPLTAADRLLIAAPHPDDETLATGELIVRALEAGSEVRVLFATDGDNNPWPQRWLEKRWRIGMAERARWGARRREEARRALDALSVGGRVPQERFLGWPDQGLTDCLMRDDAATAVLASEIDAFAPTQVAMPGLSDRHPDHSALHVLLELALRRTGTSCLRWQYDVHGRRAERQEAAPGSAQRARKLAALAQYTSQLALSRRRFLAWAQREESFVCTVPAPAREPGRMLRFELGAMPSRLRAHQVLLVVAVDGTAWRMQWRLSSLSQREGVNTSIAGGDARVRIEGTALIVEWLDAMVPAQVAWAKLHRCEPRMVVFDRRFWQVASA